MEKYFFKKFNYLNQRRQEGGRDSVQPYLACSSVAESPQLYCESAVLVCESLSTLVVRALRSSQGLPQSWTQSTVFTYGPFRLPVQGNEPYWWGCSENSKFHIQVEYGVSVEINVHQSCLPPPALPELDI